MMMNHIYFFATVADGRRDSHQDGGRRANVEAEPRKNRVKEEPVDGNVLKQFAIRSCYGFFSA